jgi:hypothetical protein
LKVSRRHEFVGARRIWETESPAGEDMMKEAEESALFGTVTRLELAKTWEICRLLQ